MNIEILRDCKWFVNPKGQEFKKGEIVAVPSLRVTLAVANEMIEAGHAKAASEKPKPENKEIKEVETQSKPEKVKKGKKK